MRRTAFLYTDEFQSYRLGDKHPLQQKRLQMVHHLLAAFGLFSPEGPIDWIEPTPASTEEILQVHIEDYVAAVMRAATGERDSFLRQYGLGPGDTPAFDGMYDATALYAGGTIDAARLVLSGRYDTAFNVAGGLHHAMPDRASGFCVFNDLAMGIYELLGRVDRVAYIDIDAHHGDGVQAIFYDDPRVLTISLHESGQYLFPGTGFPEEIGAGDAEGTALNVPLLPGTPDDVWHEAFDAVVPEALDRFAPEALVLQLGADAHWLDPLAHLQITSRAWIAMVEKILALDDGCPVVVTGGGGYNVRTVARLWTMAQALCAGIDLPDIVPPAYDALYGVPRLHDATLPPHDQKLTDEARRYLHGQLRMLQPALALL